jgi:hypothetical protein
MRPVTLLLTALVVVLSACATTVPDAPPTASETDHGALVDDLRDAVAAVAAAQAAADTRLLAALAAVRAVDEGLAPLRAVDTIDDGVAAWPDAEAAFRRADVTDLRAGYLATAAAVDRARETLATTRIQLTSDWEVTYLDAEDEVLAAVRSYAESADRLAQLLERHWPAYVRVADQVSSFVERRWFFRSPQEALDALTVELDTLLIDLAAAQGELAQFRREREAAALAVNEATAEAVAVWNRRPTPGAGG